MPTETLVAACTGKLPSHGDFVSYRAGTPALRAFDEWIQNGLYRARHRDGSWEDRFSEAPPIGFVFTPRTTSEVLLGVMHPSHDRSGRAYPFTVACEVPKASVNTGNVRYLPLRVRSFFSEAERIVRDAVRGELRDRELVDHVEDVDSSFRSRSSPPATYERHVQRHTTGDFFGALFGSFEDPAKYRAVKNLIDVMRPLREQNGPPRLNYGIRYPLRADGDAVAADVCFWLDASLRLASTPAMECSFFWTCRSAEDSPASLLLVVGPPQARIVPDVFDASRTTEHVFPLADGGGGDTDPAQALPDTSRAVLDDADRRLADVLESFELTP